MSNHTFLAAVRFKDGSKLKFHVQDVPDDLDTIRNLIAHELKDHPIPVQSILVRTDSIPFTQLQGTPDAHQVDQCIEPPSAA